MYFYHYQKQMRLLENVYLSLHCLPFLQAYFLLPGSNTGQQSCWQTLNIYTSFKLPEPEALWRKLRDFLTSPQPSV